MPYNNTPIAPSKEVTGTVALPLARVKKIIQTDPDISQCSNNAAFVITTATEMFLHHLVTQAHNQTKSTDRPGKPRRNIQYKDVANAVARCEELEFLADVVPRTVTFKQHREKVAKEGGVVKGSLGVEEEGGGKGKGQKTLDKHFGAGGKDEQATNGASHMEIDEDEEEEADEAADEEDEEPVMNARRAGALPGGIEQHAAVVDEEMGED